MMKSQGPHSLRSRAATHLSDLMRSRTLDLLYAYDADVTVVYPGATSDVVFDRNRKRDTTLTQKGLERMLHRWEVPFPWEAHEVAYVDAG